MKCITLTNILTLQRYFLPPPTKSLAFYPLRPARWWWRRKAGTLLTVQHTPPQVPSVGPPLEDVAGRGCPVNHLAVVPAIAVPKTAECHLARLAAEPSVTAAPTHVAHTAPPLATTFQVFEGVISWV